MIYFRNFRVDFHCSLLRHFPVIPWENIRWAWSHLHDLQVRFYQPSTKFRFEFTGILWEMVMRQEFWGDVASWVRYLSVDTNIYIIPKSHYLSRTKVKIGQHVRWDVLINHAESEIRTLPFVGTLGKVQQFESCWHYAFVIS